MEMEYVPPRYDRKFILRGLETMTHASGLGQFSVHSESDATLLLIRAKRVSSRISIDSIIKSVKQQK